jgi:hypothetical protein
MFNTDFPDRADLPSTAKLIRSTIIAGVASLVILVTIVLPSEYGIDPTRVGSLLGLTPMGEIKMQLAAEAAAEAQVASTPASPVVISPAAPAASAEQTALVQALEERVSALEALVTPAAPVPPEPAAEVALAEPVAPAVEPEVVVSPWRDEISFTLTPGQGTEYKLVMAAGAIATYEFVAQGGLINYDQHGEGEGQSFSYEIVRGVEGDSGTFQAPVAGTHGWFFRNRGTSDVVVTLRTGGDYQELRKLI